jgi:hypothetical protein
MSIRILGERRKGREGGKRENEQGRCIQQIDRLIFGVIWSFWKSGSGDFAKDFSARLK